MAALTWAQRAENIKQLMDNIIARGGEYTIRGRTWRNTDLDQLQRLLDRANKEAAVVAGTKRGSVGYFGLGG